MATSTPAELAAVASQTGQNKGNQAYGYSNGGDAPVSLGNATFKASDNVMVPNPSGGTVNAALRSPVASISTDGAATTLNSGLTTLNTISPTTAPGYVAPTDPNTGKNGTNGSGSGTGVTAPKAYFTNAAGQEAEYTQDQLNDPANQKFLTDNGYVQTKTEGPNFDTSGGIKSDINAIDSNISSAYQSWQSYNVDQDSAFQSKAANITAQYDQLTAAMNKSNAARAAALTTLGYRTGATQYAGSIQAGIEGEELSQANQRISKLALDESSAITDARTAYQEARYQDFSRNLDALEKIRQNKSDALDQYNKTLSTAIQAAQDADAALQKDVNGVLNSLQNAPQEVRDAVAMSKSLNEAVTAGQGYIVNAPGIVGEYQYYTSQALAAGQQPVDFETYQNQDANRKAKIAAAGQNTDRILSVDEAKALGVPFGTTAKQAFGKTPTAPPTEAQSKDAAFAARTSQSNDIITSLQDDITKMNPSSFLVQAAAEPTTLGNALVSDNVRQVRQAERNFLNSVLRRESGAAISASEFSEGQKQYFPRPGDDAATLAQKAANRQLQVQSLAQSAGPALINTLSEPSTGQGLIQQSTQSKSSVDSFISQYPKSADKLSSLSEAGYNDDDILNYINLHPELKK